MDRDFKPAFPLVITPEEYLKEIKGHLEVISGFLEFKRAAREVLALIGKA